MSVDPFLEAMRAAERADNARLAAAGVRFPDPEPTGWTGCEPYAFWKEPSA